MKSIIIRKHRKGQAAMEFLMTYGWAILAAIIAIGVLAYFGVFSPGKLVSGQGLISAPFNVDAFAITPNTITLEVTQNLGNSINLKAIAGAGCAAGALPSVCGFSVLLKSPEESTGTCAIAVAGAATILTGDATGVALTAWPSGAKKTFTANGCNNGAAITWIEGDQVGADLKVTYRTSGSDLDQVSTGSVRGVSQG